jgi:hypothetical protein
MRIPKTTALLWIAGAVWIASHAANAYGNGTPDAQPPAQEQVCDDAGLLGSAYGLCVAFCEANDCDTRTGQGKDERACEVLRDHYAQVTGELTFPCEAPEEELK